MRKLRLDEKSAVAISRVISYRLHAMPSSGRAKPTFQSCRGVGAGLALVFTTSLYRQRMNRFDSATSIDANRCNWHVELKRRMTFSRRRAG